MYIDHDSLLTFGFKYNPISVFNDMAQFEPKLVHINNVKAPLLRIVPFQFSQNHDRITYSIQDPYYIPLAKNIITSIKFELKTNTGEPFPFLDNAQTIIVIHLKKLDV